MYCNVGKTYTVNRGGGLPKQKFLRPLILNPFLPVLSKIDGTVNPETRKQTLH